MPVKIPANLFYMPWNVKKQIVGHTDTFARYSLRKLSEDFSQVVDRSSVHFDCITVTFHKSSVVVSLEADGFENSTEYISGTSNSHRCVEREDKFRKTIVSCSQSVTERAVLDLWTIIKNPNASIGEFAIARDEAYLTSRQWGSENRNRLLDNKFTFMHILGQKLKMKRATN